ncbi:hypothetical protein XH84_02455 [Bradyrhizobium nanningense]|nr:hypothetical protein XH84_02455 [Bradyrhizobium nanningense]TQF30874.1 hypothetical protein UNPA324_15575 [Bradyrhizobium sp. UNPA324]
MTITLPLFEPTPNDAVPVILALGPFVTVRSFCAKTPLVAPVTVPELLTVALPTLIPLPALPVTEAPLPTSMTMPA